MKRLLTVILSFVIFLAFFDTAGAQTVGRMYFENSAITVKTGEVFSTPVYIDTAGSQAAGADALVNYNPVFLQVESVSPGFIFDDYPLAANNAEQAVVSLSGISGSPDELFEGSGVLGTITWRTLKSGVTDLTIEHELGNTTDSNIAVTFGNGDALGSVGSATVTIEAGATAESPSGITQTPQTEEKNIIQKFIDKVNEIFAVKPEIDPYDPIPRLDPKTSPEGSEVSLNFASAPVRNVQASPVLYLVLIASLMLLVIFIFLLIKRLRQSKKDAGTTITNPPTQGKL